jgi:hypothetical protein
LWLSLAILVFFFFFFLLSVETFVGNCIVEDGPWFSLFTLYYCGCPTTQPWDRKARTNSIKHSPCWEANSRSVKQEFHRLSWNPKVHYHVYKSSSLPLYKARWIKSTYLHPISLKYILILAFYLPPWSLSLYAFIIYPVHATFPRPSHLQGENFKKGRK